MADPQFVNATYQHAGGVACPKALEANPAAQPEQWTGQVPTDRPWQGVFCADCQQQLEAV